MSSKKATYIKNPYPGIRSFEIEESVLFFGREKQTQELLEILNKSHFIAITGASGSGKSSLVKAGLIPAMVQNDDSWKYISFRPGNEPIANIAMALFDSLEKTNPFPKGLNTLKKLENFLFKQPDALNQFLGQVDFHKKLLIYVDQFEEIFRFRQNEFNSEAKLISTHFVNLLISAAKQHAHPIYVIFTLRTDFLSDCTRFEGLPEMINKGYYLIPKMTLAEKEIALKGPAKYAGAEISDELIAILHRHLEEGEVSLPVFQHALMRTWDYWMLNSELNTPVGKEHYQAVGAVHNALSLHAEVIYNSFRDENQKLICKQVFKSLTLLGEDKRGIRRPSTVNEICEISNSRMGDVVQVINRFRAGENSFLLPKSNVELQKNSVIDISHESIMRSWGRLVDWVDEETKSAQTYLRLSRSAELYQEGQAGLLVNPDLQLALKWQQDNRPTEAWAKRYDPAFDRVVSYIEYSKKEYDKAIKTKEEQRARDLRKARTMVIFMGVASLVSILFLIVALNLKYKAENSEKQALEKEKWALKESKTAEEQKKRAVSQGLIAEQQQQIAEQHHLLAEEQKRYAILQQREALFQKSKALKSRNEAIVAKNKANKMRIEAEQQKDRAIKQKKIADREKRRAEKSEAKTDSLRKIAVARSMAIQSIKLYNSNLKLKKLSKERQELPLILALQAYHFNKKHRGNKNDPDVFAALSLVSESKKSLRGKTGHSDAVRSLAISNDASRFVSCSNDGMLWVHNLNKPDEIHKLKIPKTAKKGIRSVAFTGDGKLIAGTYTGKILLWNSTDDVDKPQVIDAHKSVVNQIVSLKKSPYFVSTSTDGTLRLWHSESPFAQAKILFSTTEKITALAESKDGAFLAMGTLSGEVKIFETSNFTETKTFKSQTSGLSSVEWGNSTELYLGFQSGKVEFWKAEKMQKEFFAHTSGITNMVYDSSSKHLVTSSYDATVKIWDSRDFDIEPLTITDHQAWVYCIALTPDGKTLISGSADKSIRITEIDIENLQSLLRKQLTKNMSEKNWLRYVGEGIKYSPQLPD